VAPAPFAVERRGAEVTILASLGLMQRSLVKPCRGRLTPATYDFI